MKGQTTICMKPRGMTLVEVLVTISILSFVIITALTLYDTSLRNIRTDENRLDLLADANLIMGHFNDDIRLAHEFLGNYQTDPSQIVVAALKMKKRTTDAGERVIVYAFDAKNPTRLLRSVYAGNKSTAVVLSQVVKQIEVSPVAEHLWKVSVIVEDEAAGRLNSLQASSVFRMQS